MSDTHSRAQDDAVLSSVRRIVTQVRQPEPAPVPETAPASVKDDGPPEKLILSPDFRVDAPAASARRTRVQTRTLAAERQSLEERIAELEEAVTDKGGDWEPDGSEVEDVETPRSFPFIRPAEEIATDAEIVEDTAPPEEPVAVNLPPTETEERGVSTEPEADLPETIDIDEDALQKVVADTVRAELQGELGERITRNVRKLVRQEIHRALTTRSLG